MSAPAFKLHIVHTGHLAARLEVSPRPSDGGLQLPLSLVGIHQAHQRRGALPAEDVLLCYLPLLESRAVFQVEGRHELAPIKPNSPGEEIRLHGGIDTPGGRGPVAIQRSPTARRR